jgi:hypothetical protein
MSSPFSDIYEFMYSSEDETSSDARSSAAFLHDDHARLVFETEVAKLRERIRAQFQHLRHMLRLRTRHSLLNRPLPPQLLHGTDRQFLDDV